MLIHIKTYLTGEPLTVPIDVDRGSSIQSVVADCCNQLDIPLRKNLELRNENDEVLPDAATIYMCSVRHADTLYLGLMDGKFTGGITNGVAEGRGGRGRNENDEVLADAATIYTCSVRHADTLYLGLMDEELDEAVPINRPLMPRIKQTNSCVPWLGMWVLGLLCILLSLLGIIILSVLYTKDCVDPGHGIVFDAGSSKTNMSIYQWPEETNNGTGKVRQIASCRAEGGGLSSYADNPLDAGPSMEICLDQAVSTLHEDNQPNTPQYLGATAGMRMVSAVEPSTSNQIFDSVRETMGSYPFEFDYPIQQARILSGGEEGTFGWVSINYLSNTFNEGPASLLESVTNALSKMTSESEAQPTIGAMDLGGASTQITFISANPSNLPAEYDYYLRLYGTDYHVYSTSYLCYGVNEAIRRYKAILIKNSGFQNQTDNPCAAVGYSEALDAAYLWKAPCSSPPDSPIPNANASVFYVRGTGQAEACYQLTRQLFDFDATCEYPPCSFNGVHQPKPNGKFMAFSVFAAVFEGLNISSNPSMQVLNSTRASICAKTYEELKLMPGFNKYSLLYCFEMQYIWTLWVDGYHFSEDNWDIEVISDINGVELGWSLGYMINATNRITVESTCTEVPDPVFYGVLAALLFVFILGFVVLILSCVSKKNLKDGKHERVENPKPKYGVV